MFRCITKLKGLAVDIDSFHLDDNTIWIDINNLVPCIFITAKKDTKDWLSVIFGSEKVIMREKVIEMETYEKVFAPNKSTHAKVLNRLNIQNTELAYLSHSHEFLKNANGFLCGSIWIADNITYEQASESPDIIRPDLTAFKYSLQKSIAGFYGEEMLFPQENTSGGMLSVDFHINDKSGKNVRMYVLGRYYGYAHYMSQLHPYSSAIYWNKKPGKKYTGVFDKKFEKIFANAIITAKKNNAIDSVCAVPVRPGREERFAEILKGIACTCGIDNIGPKFVCIRDYPNQKSLSKEERKKNICGAFEFTGELSGRSVALIDDISSTGSTLRECVRELKKRGAAKVTVFVLAINQNKNGAYWSSDNPQVTCPQCGEKMTLLINKYGEFFYNCIDCFHKTGQGKTYNFSDGWGEICNSENEKFKRIIEEQTRHKHIMTDNKTV